MNDQQQERDPIKYEALTDKVKFGKYRDETLAEAYELDPMYFRWAVREGVINRESFQALIPFETDDLINYDGKVNILYDTSLMRFGKHKGRVVKEVQDEDPDYMDWLLNEEVIAVSEFPGF